MNGTKHDAEAADEQSLQLSAFSSQPDKKPQGFGFRLSAKGQAKAIGANLEKSGLADR